LDKFFDAAARQWLCAARFDGKHAGYSQAPDHLPQATKATGRNHGFAESA
jgi:hypothetical protein